MDIGRLDKRISIVKNSQSQDDYGSPVETKETVLTCWSSVRNKSGKEQFQASTPFTKVVASFFIRYRKNILINETMQVEFQGNIYNIILVDNYNFSNDWLEITAEKVK